MGNVDTQIRELNERRGIAWHNAKEILDRAIVANRGLTGEERAAYKKAEDEIDALDAQKKALIDSPEGRAELAMINDEFRRVTMPGEREPRNDDRVIAEFRRPGSFTNTIDVSLDRGAYGSGGWFEHRGIFGDTGSSGGSLTIPSLVHNDIFQVMNQANVMRQTRASIIRTTHGDPIAVPVGSQGAGTQIANQDTALAGTDPTIASKTLRAYGDGNLVAVSNDMIRDAGVNILDWVANNIALAVGTLEETWLVSGDGSGKPQGIMNGSATGAAGTIATGGSLILGPAGREVEKLIDVVYSVNNYYRTNAEWLMHNNTVATVRKLRDGAGGTVGAFIWQPSPTAGMVGGEPDRLLGYPVWSSTNVSAMGSDAKIAAFGDFSRYVIREAGGFHLERSDHYLFHKDQVALRGKTRVDGVLTDVTAINYLHQAVT